MEEFKSIKKKNKQTKYDAMRIMNRFLYFQKIFFNFTFETVIYSFIVSKIMQMIDTEQCLYLQLI